MAMEASKRVSSWSVQDVLEWIEKCYPSLVGVLHKAVMKHAISGIFVKNVLKIYILCYLILVFAGKKNAFEIRHKSAEQ